MAIAISGIISVTVIIVALIMSAGYIVARQGKKMPRRKATQEEQEEIERALERYECCTRVINWISIEERPPENMSKVLVTIGTMVGRGELVTTTDVYNPLSGKWRNYNGGVIAWAEMPKPYKKPSMTA